MPFSGLDRRGAGACGRGEGAGAPTGEHRALPQRDTAICADGGHRPGLHPEPRQAARPRGGASREGGEPPRAVAAKHRAYRNGTGRRDTGVEHAHGARRRARK